jgi:zinc protease
MKRKIGYYAVVPVLLFLAPLCLAGGQTLNLEFEKFVLPNGLEVILHEDHSVPIVTVNVWYHVGSKNEKPGRTGFAHLFEHLMFEGSANAPEGMFDKWLEAAGGSNNGSTTEDRTNYYEVVPSNALELALFLEADRLATLLEVMDQDKLEGQRDVVMNERRQVVDNQPYGRAEEIILAAMFPSEHPYSWPIIGFMADIEAATLEDVKDFFRRYYTPNNASLCIAGDIDVEKTKKLVNKYFASIPPGQPVDRIEKWVPRFKGVRRLEYTDNVSLPRLYMTWHAPPLYHPGDADLDILASVLADGKNSRLYKRLVYEDQIAQDVNVFVDSREVGGVFYIIATAKPGHTLAALEAAIDEELAKILAQGPEAVEVETAVNAYEAGFVRGIQSVGGFRGKADKLNQYNVFVGRPDYIQEDLNRYLSVTPQSVQAAANTYIDPGGRVILYVRPAGDLKADESGAADRTEKPGSGPAPELMLPSFEERTLSNGLKVMVAEHHELPLVQFNLFVKAGWAQDPPNRAGVSSLTSDLQDEGTANRTALDISQDLKAIGARLGTSSFFDGSNVTLNTLKKHLPAALDILADVLVNPTFPEDELARKKKEYLASIMQEKRQPFTASFKTFLRTLYGADHPYGQPYTGTGTEASIQAIEAGDLKSFFDTYFHPNNAVMVVVGDVTADEIVPILERALKSWKKQEVPSVEPPAVKPLEGSHVYIVHKPGAAQSVIVAGHHGMERSSPDYFKGELMNTMLGGKFTSRLNANLREDKGYTYGAGSFFFFVKGLGPFLAYTQVQSEVTKESLVEMVKEFRGIGGEIPVTEEELIETKKLKTLGYPRGFETLSQIAGKLGDIVAYDLPKDYFDRYIPAIDALSAEDVMAAGKKYVRPDNMLFVIVGDADVIEEGVRELNLGALHYLDLDGNPIER